MHNVSEIKACLAKHKHFKQVQVSGSAQLSADEWCAMLPHVNGGRQVRKYIETNQTLLQAIYGERVKVTYNTGFYCYKTRRRIKPSVSIDRY